MKEFLKHNMKGDQFDDWVMTSNWLFGYLDQTLDFPEVDNVKSGQGIEPEWFYDVLAGTPDYSELNAIRQYRANTNKFDDVATIFSGVSFVEMMHYDHLQEFILALGGQVDNIPYQNTELVKINEASVDNRTALQVAIKGEEDTIKEYERLKELCGNAEDSPTKEVAFQLLNKLIADERKHIAVFKDALSMDFCSQKPDNKITFTI